MEITMPTLKSAQTVLPLFFMKAATVIEKSVFNQFHWLLDYI